jgi:hypothetical protein
MAVPIASIVMATSARATSLQMSSDNASTGWYPNEPRLTPAKIQDGKFGEIFDTQLNGEVYAQPLISGTTVLAVTENNYAYGLNAKNGTIEWQDTYGSAADPLAQIGCGDLGSSVGITGTPVINSKSGIAYFVAAKDTGVNGATQWFMEAVDVRTGATASGWPADGVAIRGSADNDASTEFDGQYQLQRPGLVLVNGVVYAAFGSLCDYGNWEGWLVGVSASSASITTMWSSEENVPDIGLGQPGGGIWQSGSPPVVDSKGDIFVVTGNGDIPASPLPADDETVGTYGEAVVELSTSGGILHPIDFFIAADALSLNNQDGDLGSGGLVALPASMGTKDEPNVMLVAGKQGILYALNQNNLGGYQQGSNNTDDVPAEMGPYGAVWAKPAVWPGNGGFVYLPTTGNAGFLTNGGSLDAFRRKVNSKGVVSFGLVGATIKNNEVFSFGSSSPIVTSNGVKSGSALVWIVRATSPSGADSDLQAYSPIPEKNSLEELWSSAPFNSAVFAQPGVDNGVIYVGTKDDTLLGFSARASAAPALTGADMDFPSTTVSQADTQSAKFTAHATTTVTSFTVSGNYVLGTPSATLPTTLSSGQTISVPVTFTPTALGANSGTLTANVTGSASEVTLNGRGETPTATFTMSRDQVNFPPQPIGGPPATPIKVTFTNVSSSPITVTGFESAVLPFSVTDFPNTSTIAANGGTLTFSVAFYPPGSSGDFVHVFDSVATVKTSAGYFGIAISGVAVPPANISTAPDVLNFGKVAVGSSRTLKFNLGDQGGFPLLITRSRPPRLNGFISLTNPYTQLAKTDPPHTIAPNTSVQEIVRFAPTADGPVSATWLLEGNDRNGVQKVMLTGTGYSP